MNRWIYLLHCNKSVPFYGESALISGIYGMIDTLFLMAQWW